MSHTRRTPPLAALLLLAAACASEVAPPPATTPAAGPAAVPDPASSPAEAAPAPVAPDVPGDPMGVVVRRLPNGLTVMLSENHEEPRIDAWITVRAGSAKDPADATGMAHYLEHMNFKGTRRLGTTDWEKERPHLDEITRLYDELFRTPDPAKRAELYRRIDAENQAASAYEVPNEMDTLYDSLGFQQVNAFTSDDQTSYVCNFPSNRLAQWAEVEAERFREPVYRLFQTELEAVYEEKNRGMDNKARVTHEARMQALFPEHPYGTQPTIGTVEHLKNPSLTKMYEYFRTWYAPGNMVVALSGDFDAREALGVLEEHFGTWEVRPVPPDPVHPTPAPQGVRRVLVPFEGEEEVDVLWLTVPDTHPERDALVMADMMLANGRTGLIDVNLMQAQKVRAAGAAPHFQLDAGYELLYAIPKPGQTLEEAEALLLGQVEALRKGAFTDEDLRAALTQFEIQKKMELESNRARVARMTDAFLKRVSWAHEAAELDRLRAVTKDEVVRAANRRFGEGRVVVERRNGKPDLPKVAKPGFTPVSIPADRHSDLFREMVARPVRPIEPHWVVAGRDYVTRDLSTGRLTWVRNPMNDLFQLAFVFDVGTDQDPRLDIAFGLLDLAGAGDLDAVAFKRRLYSLGTTIAAGAGRQETTVTVTGLDAHLEESLTLLREHFTRPTGATQDDLARLVERAIGARTAQKREARTVNGALRAFAMRGPESEYLRAPADDALRAYRAGELMDAARRLFQVRRAVQYTGPRPIEAVAALVDFPPLAGGFEALADPPARRSVRYVVPEKPRVLFVHKETAQAQVGLYVPDGIYDRAAVPVHRMYNEYMSGSMGSVVFQEIRESRALAYDAGAAYRDAEWRDDANIFVAALGTQADKTADATEVLLRIVRAMPAAEARLENARRTLDETYRTGRIGFRRMASVELAWRRLGFTEDPRPWNWERIRAMKLEDLTGFAARFKTLPYTLTVVGDRSKIDLGRLAEFGEIVEMEPDRLFAW